MISTSYVVRAFSACILIVLAACTKPHETPTPTPVAPTDKTKLNSLFSVFRSKPQNFTVPAGINYTLKGEKGTRLVFYPTSFRDANGNVISSGNINVELVEMYKPGDMIANRALTTTPKGLLKSGGQIYVNATWNGQTVYAGKYGVTYANADPASTDVMALYLGNTNNEDSLVTWSDPLISVGTFCVTATSDTTANGAMIYKFDSCSNFKWVNCDVFYYDTGVKTNVFLQTKDASFNHTNTQVFVVFPSINSVASPTKYDPNTHTFQFSDGFLIPVGIEAGFVVMTNKNGVYFYEEIPAQTVTTNMRTEAKNMPTQSIDYIKSRFASM